MDLLSSQSFVGIMNEAQSGTAKMDQITRGIRPNQSPSEMDTVARDFEAVFLTEMMRPMFESVEVDSMFGGGRAEGDGGAAGYCYRAWSGRKPAAAGAEPAVTLAIVVAGSGRYCDWQQRLSGR